MRLTKGSLVFRTLVLGLFLTLFAACGRGPGSKANSEKSGTTPPNPPLLQSMTDGSSTYFLSDGITVVLTSGDGRIQIQGLIDGTADDVSTDDPANGEVSLNANTKIFTYATTISYGESRRIKFIALKDGTPEKTGTSLTVAFQPQILMPLLTVTTIGANATSVGLTLKHAAVSTNSTFGMISVGAPGYQMFMGPPSLFRAVSGQ